MESSGTAPGALLLLAGAAVVVALLVRRGPSPPRRTAARVALWTAAALVAVPLLLGLLVALGGVLSQDSGPDTEDGADSQASTLASGRLTSGDLTSLVRAALEEHGHRADAVHCPTLTGPASEDSYGCTGSVAGWDRVQVNVHGDDRFTVVGSRRP